MLLEAQKGAQSSVAKFVNETVPTQLSKEGIAPIAWFAQTFAAERPLTPQPFEIAARTNEFIQQARIKLGVNTEKIPQANPDVIAEVARGVPNGEALLLRHHTQLADLPTKQTVSLIWNAFETQQQAGVGSESLVSMLSSQEVELARLGLSAVEVVNAVKTITALTQKGTDPVKVKGWVEKIATMKIGTVGSNRLNPIIDADKIAAASYGVMVAGIEQMVAEQTGQKPNIQFVASPNIRAGMSAMAMSETYAAVTGTPIEDIISTEPDSSTNVAFNSFLTCPNVVLPFADALQMMAKYGDFPWANGDWTPEVRADVNKLFGTGTVERIHGTSPGASQSNTRTYVEGLVRPHTLVAATAHTQQTNELMNAFGLKPERLGNGGYVGVTRDTAYQVSSQVQAKGMLKETGQATYGNTMDREAMIEALKRDGIYNRRYGWTKEGEKTQAQRFLDAFTMMVATQQVITAEWLNTAWTNVKERFPANGSQDIHDNQHGSDDFETVISTIIPDLRIVSQARIMRDMYRKLRDHGFPTGSFSRYRKNKDSRS